MLPASDHERLSPVVRRFYDMFLEQFQECPYCYNMVLGSEGCEGWLQITFPSTEPVVKHIQILVANREATDLQQLIVNTGDVMEIHEPINIMVFIGKYGMHAHFDGILLHSADVFRSFFGISAPTNKPDGQDHADSLIRQSLNYTTWKVMC